MGSSIEQADLEYTKKLKLNKQFMEKSKWLAVFEHMLNLSGNEKEEN